MLNKVPAVFFTAIGVIIGGTLIGGLAAIFTKDSPLKMMQDISERLKIYAIVSSIGGTFNNLRLLEGSIFQGNLSVIFQQMAILMAGLIGANVGVWIIRTLTGGF